MLQSSTDLNCACSMVHPPKNEPHSIQKPVNSCTNPQGSSHSAKFSSFGTGKETTSRSHMSELGWCGSSLPCYPRGVAGVAPKLHGSQPEREVDQTRQGKPLLLSRLPKQGPHRPIGLEAWKPEMMGRGWELVWTSLDSDDHR